MDQDTKESDISSLLEVNRLDYRLPPSLSVANSRAEKSYPALSSSTEMGGQTIFVLSSGAAYVDFLNSYISFDAWVTTTAAADQAKFSRNVRMSPHVGWANAIQKITIIHSSGVELDRVNDGTGEWIQIQNYYNRSAEKRRVQCSLYHLNDSSLPGSVKRNTTNAFSEVGVGARYETHTTNAANAISRAPTDDDINAVKLPVDQSWQQKMNYLGRFAATTVGETEAKQYSGQRDDRELVKGVGDANGTRIHVVIPMSHIAGLFDVDLLAPSFLAAGMRIEITWYSKEHFFQTVPFAELEGSAAYTAAGDWLAGTTVTIRDARVHLESFTLTDSIVRKLSQISAKSGLEWYWDAIHQSSLQTPQKNGNIQINRALSRANSVVLKVRSVGNINAANKDSYASDPWEVQDVFSVPSVSDWIAITASNQAIDSTMISFQVQLGAQYIPAAPVQFTEEFLHSAIKTFNGFRRSDEIIGVPLYLFKGITQMYNVDNAFGADQVTAGLAISAVPLESSSTLQQSGSAISAQRTAVVNFEWKAARDTDKQRRVDLYVPYSKLATLYLDSVVVRS